MKRRDFVQALAGAALASTIRPVLAQANATRTIVVPFAPGGSGDITARLLGQYITDKTGQTVVVENKPGANGIIGVEAVKLMPADGRTLLLATTSTHAANPSLFKSLPYDPQKDFSLVGVFGAGGSYMLVQPQAAYKNLADFVAYAKSHPGILNFGHFNASSNVPAALLNITAGIEMTAVPYKQIGTAVADLVAGRLDVLFIDTTAADAYVASGQLRALAVNRLTRLPKYPDLPTIAETYPGFDTSGFLGIAVARDTPVPAQQALNDLVNGAIMADPMHERLISFGFTPKTMSLQTCGAFAVSEREKWARYIQAARIEPV